MAGLIQIAWRSRRGAFTLIEVLVVVAIIASLLAILLPSLSNARVQARRTVCLSNMHQLAIGIAAYMGDYRTNPPQWRVDPNESYTDGVAIWQGGLASAGGQPVRLGMLYPRYIGKNENVFYCPDAAQHPLLAKDSSRTSIPTYYPWTNWSKNWTYCSYEYRPRFWLNSSSTTGQYVWLGMQNDFRHGAPAIAADGFSGPWHTFGGPYPVHTPIVKQPKMLYYNVAYIDGSARAAKDFVRSSPSAPGGKEFKTRAGPLAQADPYVSTRPRASGGDGVTYTLPAEYTHLTPSAGLANPPLPPIGSTGNELTQRNNFLNGAHIDRAWTYFDSVR